MNLDYCPIALADLLKSVRSPESLRNGISINTNWKPMYIIAMTARSGSTMLCSALQCLPETGKVEEYFNPRGPFQNFHTKYGGSDFSDYLHNINDFR
jgi:hypothetical protein